MNKDKAQSKNDIELQLDSDVKKVLEFMEANLPIRKCVDVANAVNELAKVLWGRYVKPTDRYDQDYFIPLRLRKVQSLPRDDMSKQLATKE